jgi:hypothetical protein
MRHLPCFFIYFTASLLVMTTPFCTDFNVENDSTPFSFSVPSADLDCYSLSIRWYLYNRGRSGPFCLPKRRIKLHSDLLHSDPVGHF